MKRIRKLEVRIIDLNFKFHKKSIEKTEDKISNE